MLYFFFYYSIFKTDTSMNAPLLEAAYSKEVFEIATLCYVH